LPAALACIVVSSSNIHSNRLPGAILRKNDISLLLLRHAAPYPKTLDRSAHPSLPVVLRAVPDYLHQKVFPSTSSLSISSVRPSVKRTTYPDAPTGDPMPVRSDPG